MSKLKIKKWLVVQVKPNSYDMANRNLQRQGFETFIPKMKVTNKINNKFVTNFNYVFPGYIFVSFNQYLLKWQKINSTYGVNRVLTFNNRPEEISSELILQIKINYNLNDIHSHSDNLNDGDLIKFYSGPFTDFLAKVEKVDKKNRVWLLLEYNNKIRRLKFNKSKDINYRKF